LNAGGGLLSGAAYAREHRQPVSGMIGEPARRGHPHRAQRKPGGAQPHRGRDRWPL